MQYDNNNYRTPKTDWALILLTAAASAVAGALLYAPASHWLSLLA